MPRIKIDLPADFSFTTVIPVRITDLNYGGHVGNDSVLSLLHEARVQYLKHYGYGELDFAGTGLIMGDVAIEFKKEIIYGDTLRASVTAGEFSSTSFTLFYKLEKEPDPNAQGPSPVATVVIARTGMVCYNYEKKKVAPVPEEVIARLAPPAP